MLRNKTSGCSATTVVCTNVPMLVPAAFMRRVLLVAELLQVASGSAWIMLLTSMTPP